jgi:hypothetical protein
MKMGDGEAACAMCFRTPPAKESSSRRGLDSQIASLCEICFIVFPERAEVSSDFFETGFMPSPPLMSSHWLPSRNRTRCQSPWSFFPSRVKFSFPDSSSCKGDFPSVEKKPLSHTMTVPPPYWPLGMVPSKLIPGDLARIFEWIGKYRCGKNARSHKWRLQNAVSGKRF